MTALPPGASPWRICDRSGHLIGLDGCADWLSEWRRRIAAIEAADRPADLRRAGLDRFLRANAAILAALAAHGAEGAALDATASAIAADARLADADAAADVLT